jgi:hypothetical protein
VEVERRAQQVLVRGHELARLPLESIEQAAAELVELSAKNSDAVTHAYRVARSQLEADPSTENKQVVSLIRRSIEIGMGHWSFEETGSL